jgi:hypothetical protein
VEVDLEVSIGSIESFQCAEQDVEFNFKPMGESNNSMFEAISYQLYGF